jgi:pimeloyl-ACP methyl ester carboxylesterase
VTLAALNGLHGDQLAARGSRLALGMEVRRGGAAVPVTPAGLASAFPDASSRIAVFIHGLCETDEAWRQFPLGGDRSGRRTYGERLQDEVGFTPVHVRYNTGLRISQNGRALALLLDELVDGWPTSVDEIVLVGHSMGGLVARSACHYAEHDARRWIDATRHVFCLGAPHLGVDLEKGLNVISFALGRVPETRPWSSLINPRSTVVVSQASPALT